jgi:hypothetical protein
MMACVTLLGCLCFQSEGTGQDAKSPPVKAETRAPEFMVVGEVRDNVLRGFVYSRLRPVQLSPRPVALLHLGRQGTDGG